MCKKYLTNYQSPNHMYKELREIEGEKNEGEVYSIKEVLNRLKKTIKNLSKDKKFIIKENEYIINIVERILYFNQLEQQ